MPIIILYKSRSKYAEIGKGYHVDLNSFDPLVLALIMCKINAAFTEIGSNTANATNF